MARKMNENWYALRWKVLNRDLFTCQYCGQTAPNVVLQVDHIVARANGGTDELNNLKTACVACNIGKNLKPLNIPPQVTMPGHSRANSVPKHELIMGYLKINQYATATEISQALGINRGNVSHILATDKEHFVFSHREKQNVCYKMVNQ